MLEQQAGVKVLPVMLQCCRSYFEGLFELAFNLEPRAANLSLQPLKSVLVDASLNEMEIQGVGGAD